jgi:hypothetical protein
MTGTLSVPIQFEWDDDLPRTKEPVSLGLPWPKGAITDERYFHLIADSRQQILQTRILDRWPDGSIRWCLFDFVVDRDFGKPDYCIRIEPTVRAVETPDPISEPLRTLDFGLLTMNVTDADILIRQGLEESKFQIQTVLAEPDALAVWDFSARQVEEGPLRSRVRISGPLIGQAAWSGKLLLSCDLDFYSHIPVTRARVTLRNTMAADHPGGNWDLGNAGSVYIQELAVSIVSPSDSLPDSRLSLEPGQATNRISGKIELVQHSSGGENWQSETHLNRHRELPKQRGYTLDVEGQRINEGLRATPVLQLGTGRTTIGCAIPHFWQNFPKSLTATSGQLSVGLFPSQTGGPHELQGGEQKTQTLYLSFGPDDVSREPLLWARSPVIAHADPEWYAYCGVVPYLTSESVDSNTVYKQLVNQAIEGSDTFLHKREKIDEYGWRNFGDIYGDHEAVYWKGPKPMISHYNNQYDCVAGLLYQFLRSGRTEWYRQALECAEHTVDIDQYHTGMDKAAYNQGLFWHTYHYAPADTGTHRSYPKSLRQGAHFHSGQDLQKMGQTGESLKKAYAVGGGPASSHNYNYGLMLAYFLTGEPAYRIAAIDLAQFVIDMENPVLSPFRWLTRQYTGLATESGGGGYHGPGRASANSLNALLVGHQLTGEYRFLDKAEQIIRRVVHPTQDLAKLDLLNAELRWFYTMFLQALGKYLDYKVELNELDGMYDYAQQSLLHYARWMAVNERPILEKSDELQYPTETWAAQDMRKVEVFQYAARHVSGSERARFLERAEWFFRYVEKKLSEFPTKSLCRPVVLMLNFGWSRAWWQRNQPAVAPEPVTKAEPRHMRTWKMFTPQKVVAIKRAKRLIVLGGLTMVATLIALIVWVIRHYS